MWLHRKPCGNLLRFYHITFSRILTSLLAMTILICNKIKSILTWKWISYAKYWKKKSICSANVTSLLHQILFHLTSASLHVSAILSSDSEFSYLKMFLPYYRKNVPIYVWYFTKLYRLPLLKKKLPAWLLLYCLRNAGTSQRPRPDKYRNWWNVAEHYASLIVSAKLELCPNTAQIAYGPEVSAIPASPLLSHSSLSHTHARLQYYSNPHSAYMFFCVSLSWQSKTIRQIVGTDRTLRALK